MSRLQVSILFVLIAACAPLCYSASNKSVETPQQCKKRLGSERECFAQAISAHQELCALKIRGAQLEQELGRSDSLRGALACGGEAKKQIRPFYEATLRASKKPAAAAATKKALQAFFAVMADPPGSIGLRNNVESALAELEVEMP